MKYLWCLDATCVAEWDSFEEAVRKIDELTDPETKTIDMVIGDHHLKVDADLISVMSEEDFDRL
jgi:hypothetical protein